MEGGRLLFMTEGKWMGEMEPIPSEAMSTVQKIATASLHYIGW